MPKLLLFLICCLGISFCRAQTEWKLRSEKDSIKIFTARVAGSRINAIKIEAPLSSSLSQLVAVILDINSSAEWIYNTRSCVLLKQVSPTEVYYYSEIGFPWPAANRDFVAHIKVVQDPRSKAVVIDAENVSEQVPPKPGIVRISQSVGRWTILPLAKNLVSVEYVLQVDPGGNIPAWLINLFSTRGPFETFKKLRLQVQKPAYQRARLSFIED